MGTTDSHGEYKMARDLCRSLGPRRVAFDYANKAGTITQIAQDFSKTQDRFREAAVQS